MATKILPVLFNPDMVRALLDNRKTATRRLVKPQPVSVMTEEERRNRALSGADPYGFCVGTLDTDLLKNAPYRPGDILYVRETWRVQSARRFDADARIEFKAGGDMVRIQFPGRGDQYHSRREYDAFVARWADDRWHPSIHMPREAARIFLRVTDVRVERLQAVMDDPPGPENQIVKEGCKYGCDFIATWERTIKPADRALYGWNANPWVWVIEFERCEKPKETVEPC